MSVELPPSIIDLEDFTESINMILYADSGVGKTVFAGTDDVLFLSLRLEKGTISAKRQGSKGKIWKIDEWNDLQDAYDWLEANPEAPFKWIVIDSVTAMQKMCMAGVLKYEHSQNAKRDIDVPQIQDWQKYYNSFDRFIAAFNDLPFNVLYTATTMQNEDPDGEEIVLPNLYGRGSGYSISQSVCASVAVVGRLYTEVEGRGSNTTTTRQILFEAQPPYFAKDRYDVLPKVYPVTNAAGEMLGSLRDVRERIEKSEAPSTTATSRKVPAKKVPAKKAAGRRIPARPTK